MTTLDSHDLAQVTGGALIPEQTLVTSLDQRFKTTGKLVGPLTGGHWNWLTNGTYGLYQAGDKQYRVFAYGSEAPRIAAQAVEPGVKLTQYPAPGAWAP
jgi:hypothetical protein